MADDGNTGGSKRVSYLLLPLVEGQEYPRWEIYHDGTGFTVGRRGAEENKHVNDPGYAGNLSQALVILSKKLFTEKIKNKTLLGEYTGTLEELIDEIDEHTEYMKDLAAGLVESFLTKEEMDAITEAAEAMWNE